MNTFPRQLGFGPEGPKPKLPPLGRRLEVLAGIRGVTRHRYIVPLEESHVEYLKVRCQAWLELSYRFCRVFGDFIALKSSLFLRF